MKPFRIVSHNVHYVRKEMMAGPGGPASIFLPIFSACFQQFQTWLPSGRYLRCVLGALTRLYLRTFFILFLSPLPPGGPGEGPDYHFPKETGGFGPIPARMRGKTCFVFSFWPSAQLG